MNNTAFAIIAINAVWSVIAFAINESWYRHCEKMNKDWAETCMTIIKEQYQSEEVDT